MIRKTVSFVGVFVALTLTATLVLAQDEKKKNGFQEVYTGTCGVSGVSNC